MIPIIYFVLPCYNEADSLPVVTRELEGKIHTLIDARAVSKDSRILLVDDGSTDETWHLIGVASERSPFIKGIRLAQNYGQQMALYAGLTEAKDCCDAVITMDADGQHDIDAIDDMLREFAEGYDVVCALRKNRDTDTLFKLTTVNLYYFLMDKLGAGVIEGHADYRLASKTAIEMYLDKPKEGVYMRGDFPGLPLPVSFVDYGCKERIAGRSRFSLKKMFHLAIDGMLSNGIKPAKKAALAGITLTILGVPFLASRKPQIKALSAAPCTIGGMLIFLSYATYARHLEDDKLEFEIADRV